MTGSAGSGGGASDTTAHLSDPGLHEATCSEWAQGSENQTVGSLSTSEMWPRLPEGHNLAWETSHRKVRCQEREYS